MEAAKNFLLNCIPKDAVLHVADNDDLRGGGGAGGKE